LYRSESIRQELLFVGALFVSLWIVCELADFSPWLLFGVGLGYLGWHLYHLWRLVRWVDNSANRLPQSTPGAWGYVYYRLEVKRRKSASRKKQVGRLLKQFKSSTQALPDATIVLDGDFQIQWMNDAVSEILGVKRADTGQPITNLIRNPDFQRYLLAGRYSESLQLESMADKVARISIRIVPYGRQQYLLLARDVTRQHLLEQMRRDFVSNASHELRTPLSVLQGSLEQLEGKVGNKPNLANPVARMKRQSERMMRILQDLLTLARLESRREPEQPRAVNLSQLVGEVVEEVRPASDMQGGHSLSAEIEKGIGVLANYEDLHAAVSNLVMNAVRYTPPDGEIRVALYATPIGVHFEVIDTGMGISPQHLQRLTERFYRVDIGRSRESGGTGLGLSIVKHILDQYNTSLEISSEPGVGSNFGFTLPGKIICELGPQVCSA
jgi:two-component system phosphate regulon sensor histidine kinase PhoR